jgi:hypothetical protein
MKGILVLLGGLWTASQSFAQGTLVFANLASGVNAPVSNPFTGARITNPNFLADLYFSNATNAPTDILQAAGFNVPFSTTTAGGGGGYFLGGTRTVNGATGAIEAQVRIWDSQLGATFEAARSAGGLVFVSFPFVMNLAIPPAPAPPMAGLQFIPEPTPSMLAGLCLAVCLILRTLKNT